MQAGQSDARELADIGLHGLGVGRQAIDALGQFRLGLNHRRNGGLDAGRGAEGFRRPNASN